MDVAEAGINRPCRRVEEPELRDEFDQAGSVEAVTQCGK
jgi:hypothetical protein